MNSLDDCINLLLNLFIFLAFVYMVKSSMGINWVKNCHAEEVLLGICNHSVPTIKEKMYETYPIE